jgi:hypothetical protein
MKKSFLPSFLPSFSKGLIAFGFCAAVVAMTACSESSSSGGGATAPDNSANLTASNCALANKYLPSSSIVYVDDGNGGCLVSGQSFSNEDYASYDAALVSFGFVKSETLPGSPTYTKILDDASVLMVGVTYANETQILSATVTKQEKNYLYGAIEEFGELLVKPLFRSLGVTIEWNYTASNSLNFLYSTQFTTNESSYDFRKNLSQQLSLQNWQNVTNDVSLGVQGVMEYKSNVYKLWVKKADCSVLQKKCVDNLFEIEINKLQ